MGKTAERTYRASHRACLRIFLITCPCLTLDRTGKFKEILEESSQNLDAL
jgi:hypothetical protein